ncbi:hypothetical protein D0A37_19210 [Microcoleus vaginatus HSN003]|nr:hypothetical protein D0A37_19210 [Microcoleus vaginatus HSN003]
MRPGLLVKIWRGMRGLGVGKTRNISQKYVSIEVCSPACFQWQKTRSHPYSRSPPLLSASGQQLAARFHEQLTEQPTFSQKLYILWMNFTKTS